MTRSMLDSVTAADIPSSFRGMPTELVAGYIDGPFAWKPEDWQRHAARRQVRIATRPATNDGHVLDIEPGNADARGTVAWVRMRRAAGLATPAIYCFSDAGPAGYRISDVRRELDAAGETRPLFWIAKWDDDPSTFDPSGDPSIIGKQYANPDRTGGHFDASVVADHWPGVDPASAPRSNDPVYLGATPAVVTLARGEVGWLSAIFRWPDGRERTVARKVYAERPGMRFYAIYPPADPDGDVTEDLDAQPGMFLVTVTPS